VHFLFFPFYARPPRRRLFFISVGGLPIVAEVSPFGPYPPFVFFLTFADLLIGNNYGIGDLRKNELLGSCAALQIDPARCMALDHPELQDNPTVWWDTALVQTIVQQYIDKWNIDAVCPVLSFLCFLFFFFSFQFLPFVSRSGIRGWHFSLSTLVFLSFFFFSAPLTFRPGHRSSRSTKAVYLATLTTAP
jgi:hypothetical protein